MGLIGGVGREGQPVKGGGEVKVWSVKYNNGPWRRRRVGGGGEQR